MLHRIKVNWADLESWKKNGTFLYHDYTTSTGYHTYEDIETHIACELH